MQQNVTNQIKKIRKVAGTVPIRRNGNRVEVLLVQAKRSGRWLFPKGGVEKGEQAKLAAVRETEEEAGVRGTVSSPNLGVWQFKNEKHKMWLLFTSEILSEYLEKDERVRKWVPEEEVTTHLAFNDGRTDKFVEMFQSAKSRWETESW